MSCVLRIDGGGTKTVCAILDNTGMRGSGEADPSNAYEGSERQSDSSSVRTCLYCWFVRLKHYGCRIEKGSFTNL